MTTQVVESMAYKGEKPWAGLGYKVNGNLSLDEMLKAAKLDWTVSKQPVYLKGGKIIQDQFAIVRDSDQRVLSMAGKGYNPVQNREALGFFSKFLKAGRMEMDTAGSLVGGKYVWGMAKLGSAFDVGKGDRIEGYLLVACPHVLGKALLFQTLAMRPWCWNTITMALGSSLRGDGRSYRIPHSMVFNEETQAKAEEALGLSLKLMDEFREVFPRLAKAKIDEARQTQYFQDVIMNGPPKLLAQMQDAVVKAPGQDLVTTRKTWWGALNAVTYTTDHLMSRTADTRMRRAWFAGAAAMKRRALKLAIEGAKSKR